ncbi:FAD-dependent thymidylate synthase [Candidatus Acidulodesulfobacterium sp. H_13]|uniref:FAD-dependent thymidylate synthase n=1 Tax=Candidatus Acidulodesulfobacterium sp. H_13 TaxID=3395470 RepID=UPI003AF6AC10
MVKLINYTSKPEVTIAIAARLCYSSYGIAKIESYFDEGEKGLEKARKLIKKIRSSGHESVLEHSNFTFGVENLSRSASHQLVRHRIASYSQRSQRYVKETKPKYVIPDSIAENSEFLERYDKAISDIFSLYGYFLENNVPAEDARYILPNATETQLIFTMNARELLHFFRLRGCERAQWEIRRVAREMFKLVSPIAPSVFIGAGPACVTGNCSEGEFSCGKPSEIRASWSYGDN